MAGDDTDSHSDLLNEHVESVNEFKSNYKKKKPKSRSKYRSIIEWTAVFGLLFMALYFVLGQIRTTELEYDKTMKAVVQSECYVKPHIPHGGSNGSSSRDCLVQLEAGQKVLISIRWNFFPKKGDIVTLRRYKAEGLFSRVYRYEFVGIDRRS